MSFSFSNKSLDCQKNWRIFGKAATEEGLNTNLNKIIYCIKKSGNAKKGPRAFFEKHEKFHLLRKEGYRIAW